MEDKKEKSKVKFFTVLKYFWPFIKQYKWRIAVSFVTSAVAIISGAVYVPVIYSNIVSFITHASFPSLTSEIKTSFLWLALAMTTNVVFWRIYEYTELFLKTRIGKGLSDQSFGLIIEHSRGFFADNFSGALMAKQGRYVNSFMSIMGTVVYSFWGTLIALAGILIVVFHKDTTLGAVFLVWLIIFSAVSIFFAKYKIPFDERRAEANSRTTATLSDIISNILSLKVFSAGKRESNNYSSKTNEESMLRWKAGNISNIKNVVLQTLAAILEVVGLYVVVVLWSRGDVSLDFVVLVQVYIISLMGVTWNIGNSIIDFESAMTDAKEMIEIFETPIGIKDPEVPEKCKIKDGAISFDNISFEYKDGKDVFKKFKLEIPAGQKVGFVGHSGSGKTTITNLLLRFEDVQKGKILIDGQDIRNITQDDLRTNISYVPQEPALFHRTLEENIMYGNPKASKLKMLEASKKAHADEFIQEFKDGYETLVGERGVKLSGGQRQRVAIARVMLKDAPILILDEATSSLDSISENFIQQAFEEVMKGRTTLVIAHRLSTIQKMDRIVVLEKGKIVEDGGHAELLEKGGYYFRLWQAQKDGII